MSHFTVGVIVPNFVALEYQDHPEKPTLNEQAIDMFVNAALQRYNESLHVQPYNETCYCVGNKAMLAMHDYAEDITGGYSGARSVYWALPEEERTQEKWAELIAPIEAAEKQYKAEHEADFLAVDPECSFCHGTGLYETKYNPESQWDWYVVGGRWDGDMVDNPQESENGFNFGAQHHTFVNNTLPVAELIKRYEADPEKLYTFFALVTPDGEWHESGSMGWWGIVTDEKKPEDWRSFVAETYLKYQNCYIVSIDAHI